MIRFRAVVVAALGLSLTACSSSPSAPQAGSSTGAPPAASSAAGTTLVTALGRIAATEYSRRHVRFSDNDAIRKIGNMWEEMAGYGSQDLVMLELQGEFGLRNGQARYAVTAGESPGRLVVLAGGQDASKIRSALTAKGWTADGDRLVAPKQSADAEVIGAKSLLPQVRLAGDEMLVGSDTAPLTDVVTDPGKSLAADPAVRSLADCLGDVVLAELAGPVAVGVPRPSAGGKIRAVVCSSWDSDASATAAAQRQRTAYSSGRSRSAPDTPYAELFRDVDVTATGRMVRVEATVAGPSTVLDAFVQRDLPALTLS
ncbi:hypothetical protein GCM10010399_45370 [Dactylosporangium fulvum]|uniref:Lipoprotein n=1 Tax=Dactylosporangium fulvum TaxID=53359 RepID=A0ABY5VTF7_9ACTN|nr:hypothetical protein [Dactylosporangium fulvum]UWP81032.1 hypothetical protein Dfulv_38825 [Dactylosporangium fulvum]